jgi:hypothetical protein
MYIFNHYFQRNKLGFNKLLKTGSAIPCQVTKITAYRKSISGIHN